MTNKKIIIGIGDAGCKMLSKYNTTISKLFINGNSDVSKYENSLFLEAEHNGKYYPVSGNTVYAKVAVFQAKADILKKLIGKSDIYILTSLGGRVSSGASKKIAELCIEFEKNVKILTGLPFSFEGRRRVIAQKALTDLAEICSVQVCDYDEKSPNNRMNLASLFNYMDELILEELTLMLNDSNNDNTKLKS